MGHGPCRTALSWLYSIGGLFFDPKQGRWRGWKETEEEKEPLRKEIESANLVLANDLQATMAHMNKLAISGNHDL